MFLHLRSKFRINRPIWRWDIAKKGISIRGLSAILNLQNFNILSKVHAWSGNLRLSTKFDQNRIIHGWYIETNYFQNGGRPPSWIFENCSFVHVTYISACDSSSRSKLRINRTTCRRDIAKKGFSIWRPSAIWDLLWRHHIASVKCFLFIFPTLC